MPRRELVIAGSLLMLLVGVLAITFWPDAEKPEPEYEARTLSEWLNDVKGGSLDARKSAKAQTALLAIGTNALPCYLEWLSYEPGPFDRLRPYIARKAQTWFRVPMNVQDKKLLRVFLAQFGLSVLKWRAQSAIPQLAYCASNSVSVSMSERAMTSLGLIGPSAHPALFSLTTNRNSTVRKAALYEISKLGSDPRVVEQVTLVLNHHDRAIRIDGTNTVFWLAPWTNAFPRE